VAGQTQRHPKECHLVLEGHEIGGRVTSVGFSRTLNRCIGLALVTPALAAGKQLRVRIEEGEEITADITAPPFYDPAGERQSVEGPT
jgi:sarcosine oxidase subunit alpha